MQRSALPPPLLPGVYHKIIKDKKNLLRYRFIYFLNHKISLHCGSFNLITKNSYTNSLVYEYVAFCGITSLISFYFFLIERTRFALNFALNLKIDGMCKQCMLYSSSELLFCCFYLYNVHIN